MARPKGVKDSKPRIPRECYTITPMIGKKFHRLTVLRITKKGKQPRIEVKCDCGTIKEISAYDIKYRKVVSCGCYQREKLIERQIKPNNESARRGLFNDYKFGAKQRNIEFNISFDEVYAIANNPCFYCFKSQCRLIETVGGSILVNGIDRVNNDIG